MKRMEVRHYQHAGTHQGHHEPATATGMLAIVGVLKTEMTPVTADNSKTSNSSSYIAIAGALATGGTPAIADIPITSQTSNSSRDDSNGKEKQQRGC